MVRTILAERLRWLRQAHRLSLRTLERKTGISASHISRLERAVAGWPSTETLIQLCEFYLVTPDYALGYDRDDAHVRALLDAKGRLVYYRPRADAGIPRKCADCERLLVPGRLHGLGECITFMKRQRRSDDYIFQRWGFRKEAIEAIVKGTIEQLPWMAGLEDESAKK